MMTLTAACAAIWPLLDKHQASMLSIALAGNSEGVRRVLAHVDVPPEVRDALIMEAEQQAIIGAHTDEWF